MKSNVAFYRCMGCNKALAGYELEKSGGCPRCAGGKVRMTNLAWWEKVAYMLKPSFWRYVLG